MRAFLPSSEQISDHWFKVWGEQMGIPELAVELARNPRVQDRMAMSLFAKMEIDSRFRFDEDEMIPVAQYIDDVARLIRVCGLVVQGHIIRNQISRENFEILCKAFSAEDLAIAASLPHFHGSESALGFELGRLAELVDRSGFACVEAWKAGLSDQMTRRLQLLEDVGSATNEAPMTSASPYSSEIVKAVSRKLCGLVVSSAV